ncbi:MAG: TetR/AcrR family transcriptional regulator [Pseudomonadota bacterium]
MSTRELLIDLGEQAIRARGFGGFSYADLAREAGIRKASIHHHFHAKADLGLAVLERYAERLEDKLSEFRASSAKAADAFEAAVGLYRDALGDGSSLCLCAALAGDGERSSEAILSNLSSTNAMVIDWFSQVLSDGQKDGSIAIPGDPDCIDEYAAGILAKLQGGQLLARAGSDLSIFDRATAHLI